MGSSCNDAFLRSDENAVANPQSGERTSVVDTVLVDLVDANLIGYGSTPRTDETS